jgi:hypothetical protein
MNLYSYIFIKVYNSYVKFGSSQPYVYAIGVITLLQIFSLFDIIALLNLTKFTIPDVSNRGIFIFGLLMLLINHVYYYLYKTPVKIEKQINTLSNSKIKLLKIIVWVHVLLTGGGAIVLANLK